jgi:Trp operon repressor
MNRDLLSLFDAILALQTTHDCQKLFDALLSPSELAKIVNRWRVVFPLLDGGLSQRRIAGQLHVSLGTVSRVHRTLKHGAPECRQLLHKLHSTILSTA